MALAVLVFHYDKWLTNVWVANTLQGRLGVYAVSIFFVLSGLTLTLVYDQRLRATPDSWRFFFKKRFWRLFPLLWLATGATLLLDDSPRESVAILLNITGLYGFVNPAADIATGAWSIGCELVFYAAFPALLLLAKYRRPILLGVFGLLFLLACGLAYAWFPRSNMLQSDWWEAYVQVANHAFFFVAGMVLGIYRAEMDKIPLRIWRALAMLSALAFAFWPIGAEPFFLVSGLNRIVFSALTLIFVAAFFQSNVPWRGVLGKSLGWLGAISYAVYLLHPLAFRGVGFVFRFLQMDVSYWGIFFPALAITLIVSYLSYVFLEKPLMCR